MRKTVSFKIRFIFLLISLQFFVAGCKTNSPLYLTYGDPLCETAHIFSETYNENVLIQVHLYSIYVAAMKEIGGPDEMEVISGDNKMHYYIRPIIFLSDKNITTGVQYGIFLEQYDSKQIGTVAVYIEEDSKRPHHIVLNLMDYKDLQFDNLVDMHRYEVVNAIDQYSIEPKDEINLIACLSDIYTFNGSWSLSDKTLMHFLHISEDPTKVDYSPLKNSWHMDTSPDGIIHTFRSQYYQGGTGTGSSWQQDFLYYRSGATNHIIQNFYDWSYGDEMVHGNFPYMNESTIKTWGKGENKIYLFEASFSDESPLPFNDKDGANSPYREYFTTLGAFRIVDGTLTPAAIIKTKKQTLHKVCVTACNEIPHFYINETTGILGVPLVEAGDYSFHGRYLFYEWDSKSGMFEFNGKKEKL